MQIMICNHLIGLQSNNTIALFCSVMCDVDDDTVEFPAFYTFNINTFADIVSKKGKQAGAKALKDYKGVKRHS